MAWYWSKLNPQGPWRQEHGSAEEGKVKKKCKLKCSIPVEVKVYEGKIGGKKVRIVETIEYAIPPTNWEWEMEFIIAEEKD